MATSAVMPYTDPDLDGAASAMAVASAWPAWTAVIDGVLDVETRLACDLVGIVPAMTAWTAVTDVVEIWLVDTHHLRQLPGDLPSDRVVRVTDHHSDGDVDHFEYASLQVERVGAAATLIAELVLKESRAIPREIGLLLQAAILSNSLDLTAPTTSQRDHAAIAALEATFGVLPNDVRDAMREARSRVVSLGSQEICERDSKVFPAGERTVLVAQVEAPGAMALLNRDDLIGVLGQVAAAHGCEVGVLSVVDTACQESAIVSTEGDMAAHFAAVHGLKLTTATTLRIQRVIQRKADIAPYLSG